MNPSTRWIVLMAAASCGLEENDSIQKKRVRSRGTSSKRCQSSSICLAVGLFRLELAQMSETEPEEPEFVAHATKLLEFHPVMGEDLAGTDFRRFRKPILGFKLCLFPTVVGC